MDGTSIRILIKAVKQPTLINVDLCSPSAAHKGAPGFLLGSFMFRPFNPAT
ncbi:hypothetical protein [Pseudomonas entomophila]|uniref:hypothetical protein n=1 Tax=Pseudomonas entomophila TaxID=312306 RepID=UPI0020103682|nr:hypothetical protein [Pseudomonas entomophila]